MRCGALQVTFDEFTRAHAAAEALGTLPRRRSSVLESPEQNKRRRMTLRQSLDADARRKSLMLPAHIIRSDARFDAAESDRTLLILEAQATHTRSLSSHGPSRVELAVRSCFTGLHRLVLADWFSHSATGLVLLNMGLMCLPYAGMSSTYATIERLLPCLLLELTCVDLT
jgi:hypothetical protein